MVTLGQPQRLHFRFAWPLIRRGRPLLIPKTEKPFWFEKGWRSSADGKQYSGSYTAHGHTWRGLIRIPYSGGYEAYIWHPPLSQLQRHTGHGPCFMPNGESGRYVIHFREIPRSLDHAISNIETVLQEAYPSHQ